MHKRLSATTAIAAALVSASFVSSVLADTLWSAKVGSIIPPYTGMASPTCVYFNLIGVSQADPVVPGSSFFALSLSDPGYQEKYALLLTAAASGVPVTVATTGTVAPCGYAQLRYLYTAFP